MTIGRICHRFKFSISMEQNSSPTYNDQIESVYLGNILFSLILPYSLRVYIYLRLHISRKYTFCQRDLIMKLASRCIMNEDLSGSRIFKEIFMVIGLFDEYIIKKRNQ